MKKILIADASKASLVMTSEVFKDHFPGVHVLVARTSAEALEIAKKEEQIDAFVVDYDLPDRDGAYTAAKIKKLFTIPVLITAFDRPDVQENIERLCSAYDDCLSWLAKPVNSELVVSIAQRFIEGNYRTQRRIDCMIPGIAEISVTLKDASKKAAQGKTASIAVRKENSGEESSGNLKTSSNEVVEKVCLPIMLEDCSVGGFKFRVMKEDITSHKFFKFSAQGTLNVDENMTIFVPSFESIQTGEENVGYWLWGENKEKAQKNAASQGAQAQAKKKTLSAIKRTTRQTLGDKHHEGQAVKGKVIWTTRVDGGDALIGVRSENMVLSKKLFESILLGDNKIQARKSLADAQKERARLRAEAAAALHGNQPAKEKEFAREPAAGKVRSQAQQQKATPAAATLQVSPQAATKVAPPPRRQDLTETRSETPTQLEAKTEAKPKLKLLVSQAAGKKQANAPQAKVTEKDAAGHKVKQKPTQKKVSLKKKVVARPAVKAKAQKQVTKTKSTKTSAAKKTNARSVPKKAAAGKAKSTAKIKKPARKSSNSRSKRAS